MINLEVPKKYRTLVDQARQAAMAFLRPNSRKYDQAEHTYPKELDTLAAETVKRVLRVGAQDAREDSLRRIEALTELKTAWHPIGA